MESAEAVPVPRSANADPVEATGLPGGWPSVLGLFIAFVSTLPWPHYIWKQLYVALGVAPSLAAHFATTTIRDVACVLAILTVVRLLEKRPLDSLGLRKPTVWNVLWGVAAFLVAEWSAFEAEHALQVLLPASVASAYAESKHATVDPMLALPPALLLTTSAVAGFAEELIDRGYAIPVLAAFTGRLWLGALLAWLASVLSHVPYWGVLDPLAGAPVDGVFVLLYLWRRDVSACAVAHILYDSFALVWWPILPGTWRERIGRAL
jgi:CAAX protease family protein